MTRDTQKQVGIWLLVCAAVVFAMVVVGGVTRLTRSGLSMVEWAPIMGAIPPLNLEQWTDAFHKYQQMPEFQLVNPDMDLAGFKSIFYVEYAHRLLGRTIGLVFLVPFLYFLLRRKLDKSLIPKLILFFALGGAQGLLGWFMVKSGLVDRPHVSQYRLVAHLVLALFIYASLLWTAFGLLSPGYAGYGNRKAPSLPEQTMASPPRNLVRYAKVVTGMISLMIISGGFVAGLKAGFAFNTFPLMNGYLIPPDLWSMQPTVRNLFENLVTVQFNHRLIGFILFLLIPSFWWFSRRFELPKRTRYAINGLVGVLCLQIGLGILTLLLVVPVHLAATHQAGAVLLLSVALYVNYELAALKVPVGGRIEEGAIAGINVVA